MTNDCDFFFIQVLDKIARRYQLKGCLSGTLKLGQTLSSTEMGRLYNFFGLSPIRINAKNEVRLSFDKLLDSGPEDLWLKKIGDALGSPLEVQAKPNGNEAVKLLLGRLKLAFPLLEELVKFLETENTSLQRLLNTKSKEAVNACCFQAAEALQFILSNETPITISELGAKYFLDSKALRQGETRALFMQWLRFFSPDSELLDKDEDICAGFHVLNDRLTVNAVLYGPVVYEKNGVIFDWIYKLYIKGEAATVGWSNIHNVEKMYFRDRDNRPPEIICCENEAPFSQLMRQTNNQCLLFTSGFPGSAVQKIYSLLAPGASACYHWGDSDPAGLRIAAIMNSIYPLQLYRCDISTLQKHQPFLLPLSQKQKDICQHLLTNLSNFPFADELLFTLEYGWLEQESWRW